MLTKCFDISNKITFGGHKNIDNVVEQTLAHIGLNVGLHKPNFISPLSECIRQTELPRG